MAKCDYCQSNVFLRKKSVGDHHYCNDHCLSRAKLIRFADEKLPHSTVQQRIESVHHDNCSHCGGLGPVDVHTSHTIWSAILVTSRRSRPEICCQSCGTKRKLGGMFSSLIFGWWGIPWGIIFTPIQIGRNIKELMSSPNPQEPSEMFQKLIKVDLATKVILESQAKQQATV